MEIDGDFGRIEINKKNYEKIYFPSEYERIIKNTNVKNPFEVISVNYPNRYDFPLNENKIAKVYNYKKKFSPILKNQLNYCKEVRKIQFTSDNIKISFSLTKNCDKELELFKPDFDLKNLKKFLDDIELAYDNYLPISREKFLDIQKILEFIPKSTNYKFYETFYCTETIPISKSQNLLHKLFDEKN